jgi:hypothetical protein
MATAAPVTASDVGVIGLIWALPGGGEGNAAFWTFIVPPTATSVKAPELPADATYYPRAEPAVQIHGFAFIESSLLADYAAAKRIPLVASGFNPGLGMLVFDRALPNPGIVRITAFNQDIVYF